MYAYIRLNRTCYNKCAIKFHEEELQIGEMTCIDRCAGKYMAASEKMLEALQAFEAQQMALQQATQQQQQQQGRR